jgi:phosphatidylserine decarboxylase
MDIPTRVKGQDVLQPLDSAMKDRSPLQRWLQHEQLNFLLTNRIPRIALTHAMGWYSRIRSPWLARLSIAAWRQFTELDLSDAKASRFDSLHDCFTRELKPGARTVDADPAALASPCDAIVGACGDMQGTTVFQAKGFPYRLAELFGDEAAAMAYRDGCYVTLRLTSSMYHRFHAPHSGRIERVTHHSGDTWNVNPVALKRIERLYCRNERATIRLRLDAGGHVLTMVPVAAVLVASLRLHFIDLRLHLGYRGPQRIDCDAAVAKGQELGWFEHGSTIIVFAPRGFALCPGIESGSRVRMGQRLMRLPGAASQDGASWGCHAPAATSAGIAT